MDLETRLSAFGEAIGSVSDLISGGNELLEIVPEVHRNDGWLLLTPPHGLLELG